MQQHFPAADLHRLNFTTPESERTARQELECSGGQGCLGGGGGRAGSGAGTRWAPPVSACLRCWPRSFLWQRLAQAIFVLCEKASPSAS